MPERTNAAVPPSSTRAAANETTSAAGEVAPRFAHRAGPIVAELPWSGKLTRARAHIAVVVVYRKGDHEVVWPQERRRAHLSRFPATVYEVDLGLNSTALPAVLPSREEGCSFHANFTIYWRVFDPSAIVRHHVSNIRDTLGPALLRLARPITRTFNTDQVHAAEDEVNYQLGGVKIDVSRPDSIQQARREATDLGCLGAEYGLWTRVVAELGLDERAAAHKEKMTRLKWALEEEKAEHDLRFIRHQNEHQIMDARMEIYRKIMAADDSERFALRLASNPQDIEAVTEILREDHLHHRRDTIEFISRMVDTGIIERWEVSDEVREALNWLKEATARVVGNNSRASHGSGHVWRQQRRGRENPALEDEMPAADVITGGAETLATQSPSGDVPTLPTADA
jgi:hypothetical protein